MDGFDVLALVWMIFCHLDKFPPSERDEIAHLSNELARTSSADLSQLEWVDRLLRPRSARRGAATISVAKAILSLAIVTVPEVFAYVSVRRLMWLWWARAVGAFVACVLVFRSLPLHLPDVAGWVALSLFFLSLLFLTIAMQRWFVSVLIRRFGLADLPAQKTPL